MERKRQKVFTAKEVADHFMFDTNLDFDDNFLNGIADLNWEKLPHTPVTLRFLYPPQMRDAPIKISYAKWCHLQEIKETIPGTCHTFYDNLDHHAKS